MNVFLLLTAQNAVLDKVPAVSVAGLIVSVMLIVAIPIVSILYVRKRCEMTLRSMMYGITFYVFTVYMIQQSVYAVVYNLSGGAVTMGGHIVYNTITVVLEVLGMYGGLLLLKRFFPGTKNAAGLAIGYTAIEIIMGMGFVAFMYAALMMTLNSAGLEAAVAAYAEADQESVRTLFQSMIDMPWYGYLVYGIHGLCVAVFRYCTICILYGVSIGKVRKEMFLLGFVFCAVFRVPDLMFQAGIFKEAIVVELCYVFVTVVMALISWKVISTCMMDVIEEIIQLKSKKPAKMPKIVMPK